MCNCGGVDQLYRHSFKAPASAEFEERNFERNSELTVRVGFEVGDGG